MDISGPRAGVSIILLVTATLLVAAFLLPPVIEAACQVWGKCSDQTHVGSNWLWWEEGMADGSSPYWWRAWARHGGNLADGGSFDYMIVWVWGYIRRCSGCNWEYGAGNHQEARNSTYVETCTDNIVIPGGSHSPKYRSLGQHTWDDPALEGRYTVNNDCLK